MFFVEGLVMNVSVTSANETHFSEELHSWKQASIGWPVFVVLPLAAACILSNVLVCCAVRAATLRPRDALHAYVTSLAVCDVLNAALVLPLAIAKSFNGLSVSALIVEPDVFCMYSM